MGQLHTVLQITMGWENCHLHQFVIGGRLYSVPDPEDEMLERKVVAESRVRLWDVVSHVGTTFTYLHDFGDGWDHELLLEAILLPEAGTQYPVCIGGERSAPPEDVGGAYGYENYLKVMADPKHEQHENMLQWRGTFDPERLSLTAINRALQQRFRPRKLARAAHPAQN